MRCLPYSPRSLYSVQISARSLSNRHCLWRDLYSFSALPLISSAFTIEMVITSIITIQIVKEVSKVLKVQKLCKKSQTVIHWKCRKMTTWKPRWHASTSSSTFAYSAAFASLAKTKPFLNSKSASSGLLNSKPWSLRLSQLRTLALCASKRRILTLTMAIIRQRRNQGELRRASRVSGVRIAIRVRAVIVSTNRQSVRGMWVWDEFVSNWKPNRVSWTASTKTRASRRCSKWMMWEK